MFNDKEKIEKINFLKYKNKISFNNHKISGINLPNIIKKMKRSKSNLEHKINIPINKSLLVLEDNSMKENNNLKKKLNNKNSMEDIKLKTNTLPKYEFTPNTFELLLNNNNNNNFINFNNNNSNNDINDKFYYNLICLGRETDKKEINKVNSPLIKYFLYNISQSNKKKKFNNAPLNNYYHNYNLNNKKKKIKNINLKSIKPNYSLIEEKLRIKYNCLNFKKSNLPDILSNRYSPITIKNQKESEFNYAESEGNSSSEKSKFNSLIEETILKNEKNEEIKIDMKNNSSKNIRSLFNRINYFKKKNKMILRIKDTPYYKMNFIKNIRNKNFLNN